MLSPIRYVNTLSQLHYPLQFALFFAQHPLQIRDSDSGFLYPFSVEFLSHSLCPGIARRIPVTIIEAANDMSSIQRAFGTWILRYMYFSRTSSYCIKDRSLFVEIKDETIRTEFVRSKVCSKNFQLNVSLPYILFT